MRYYIHQIADILSAQSKIFYNSEIKNLLIDSRSLSEAAGTLFFALHTQHNDGHKYVKDVYDRGVRNFVIQPGYGELEMLPDANVLVVPDSLKALQQLATYHRNRFNIPIIGITGSNGKTVVKEWLYQLLHQYFNITRSPRSYNSQIGVPLSIWQLNEVSKLGIFEAGISLPGEMERLEPMIRPTIGILTNIGEAHQENFNSLQQKCLEKLQLFHHSELLIAEAENYTLQDCLKNFNFSGKLFLWSKQNRQAKLFISNIKKNADNTFLEYIFEEKTESITIPFIDDASVENAIHCLAILLALNIPEKRFEELEPVAMRLEVKKGINNCTLINDSYNSDINSLDIALDFMMRRSLDKKNKTVLILSDVQQSGVAPDVFYKNVARLIEKKRVTRLIGIGKDISANADQFSIEKEFYTSTKDFLYSDRIRSIRDSIVLIKGSRLFRFEKISEQLEERAHETILEVNLDAIIHNYKYFNSKLKSSTKIDCMVKAFGYGVGSYELAKTLQDQAGDYLSVALADEGAELRREGITMPIMVMNPEMTSFNTLFEYNLEPEIYSFKILDAMIRESERRGITEFPVHIKFDTGMHRLGFDAEDMDELISRLYKQKGLKVRSVFSHLAGSDSDQLDYYTELQAERFQKITDEFREKLGYNFMKHILNSAGIERFPQYQFDMVRLGIGLYGISGVAPQALQPVASLKTTILQIKKLKKGETVGYNRNGVLDRDSHIACLPLGYADGLDRRLGNRFGHVYINGTLCPIIGNVCMDLCMVDVTDIDAKEGDTAIIFGKEIPVEDIAKQLNTIPYEILTSIPARVKRVYFRE